MGLDPVRALVTALRLGGDAALCAKLSCQRRALAGLTPNRFAAWRREAPSRVAETTRSRRSTDKADGMAAPSESRSANQIHTELTTRPDSTRSGAALVLQPGFVRCLGREVSSHDACKRCPSLGRSVG
jgi:hypothetical protein